MNISEVKPYLNSSLNKKQQVAGMFNSISGRYDFLNHFLSLGIDRYWRRKAISFLKKSKPNLILDIATGTGDFAIEALKLDPVKIFGVDISVDMLAVGRKKIKQKNLEDKIELLEGDSENLIFEDNKFDAVTVAFGVRNFEDLMKGLKEICRVLKPDGKLVILEFSQPKNVLINKIYNFYSSRITPKIGKAISKDKSAYSYLYNSVKVFPYGKEFCRILEECGFKDVHFESLTFGVATIYTAGK